MRALEAKITVFEFEVRGLVEEDFHPWDPEDTWKNERGFMNQEIFNPFALGCPLLRLFRPDTFNQNKREVKLLFFPFAHLHALI